MSSIQHGRRYLKWCGYFGRVLQIQGFPTDSPSINHCKRLSSSPSVQECAPKPSSMPLFHPCCKILLICKLCVPKTLMRAKLNLPFLIWKNALLLWGKRIHLRFMNLSMSSLPVGTMSWRNFFLCDLLFHGFVCHLRQALLLSLHEVKMSHRAAKRPLLCQRTGPNETSRPGCV